MSGETTNVLEFSLGDGRYCIDIAHVDEIVDATEDITSVPNADPQTVGVVDLRGETTTIVDPTVTLDLDEDTDGRRIVVLSEFDATGLLIDDVHQVLDVEESDVDTSTASESTRGVIRRDDRFVVWVEPTSLV
ncbi:chemotaxis protein CheW [Halanaeroarchaeum sulfurireducens]|uniref:Chemotaxis protein CheW n=1 Tax=Halanaeroarchaeum sulfurireducens TaxID=1604004 RepID=A0A0F7PAR0_9EURY|nr:chemotaxis protein CheW [Halanaeroarchaeum sulfurireducens]AKH97827.1 chemotaxis protein CheW [Halanaeroarchaeum sulfurireducens]ALG82221.1 chemotaxis protein CheW [Halanaeroarchaeum sulfurireducens]